MKEIISDPVHESSMLRRLDATRAKLQAMLDQWAQLGYQPCNSPGMLYDLIYNSAMMVEEGRMQVEADGDDLPAAQKEAYLKKLKHKNPHYFKVEASKCSQDPFSERGQGLWLVSDNVVSLNEKNAQGILKANSVIAENKNQEALGSKIIQIRDLFNEVNQATHGSLKMSVNELFAKDYRNGDPTNPVSLDLDTFRRILSFV